jgi:hypothetical protein
MRYTQFRTLILYSYWFSYTKKYNNQQKKNNQKKKNG